MIHFDDIQKLIAEMRRFGELIALTELLRGRERCDRCGHFASHRSASWSYFWCDAHATEDQDPHEPPQELSHAKIARRYRDILASEPRETKTTRFY